MKVLLTGGAGFIGSHIAEKLHSQKINTVILDNFSNGRAENIPKGMPYVTMDIRNPEIIEWMKKERFDFVIHQAAQISVPYSLEHPLDDCQINILGLLHISEGARLSGVKRVIFASSAAIYGDTQIFPIQEDSTKNPLSFYGLSKWTEEQYLNLYWNTFGLEYVTLRYANVYGERQGAHGEGGVIDIFCKKVLQGLPLTIFGDGKQTRDFIHAQDVADANLSALLTSYPNQAYNISTGFEISLNDLAQLFIDISPNPLNIQHLDARDGDILRSVLDSSAAQSNLNWEAKIELSKGLSNLIAYMKNY